jgi:uncharacterized membrane protein
MSVHLSIDIIDSVIAIIKLLLIYSRAYSTAQKPVTKQTQAKRKSKQTHKKREKKQCISFGK